MNIEQEIWNEFEGLSNPRLNSHGLYSHFAVAYDNRRELIHRGLNRRLDFDEDYKINKLLLNSSENINFEELLKLYPKWERISLPCDKPIIQPKFRTHKERREISNYLLKHWDGIKQGLYSKIPDNDAARSYLKDIRWGKEHSCPYCGHNRYYLIENKARYKCAGCSKKYSETVGSIFQNTKMPLIKWFEALYLLSNTKTQKISSPQLSEVLGIEQKTAWSVLFKVKQAIPQCQNITVESIVNGGYTKYPKREKIEKKEPEILLEVDDSLNKKIINETATIKLHDEFIKVYIVNIEDGIIESICLSDNSKFYEVNETIHFHISCVVLLCGKTEIETLNIINDIIENTDK